MAQLKLKYVVRFKFKYVENLVNFAEFPIFPFYYFTLHTLSWILANSE